MTHESASIRLAIDGGTPVRSSPLPRWPDPTQAEIDAAVAVLRSGAINYHTGSEGRTFEAEYASRLGRTHGVALANGTLALELALRAFGIGSGDDVIVPARTFIATASACVAVGARPVVADIDPDSNCLTPRTVAAALTPETRAVIPVHLAGWPADMPGLMELAAARDLVVIEDCAQAHGAAIAGREVGSWGHAAAFSFCQDKIITTGGEGGMLVLDDSEAYERAWAYKDHGKSLAKLEGREDAVAHGDQAPGHGPVFRWVHDSFGTNWRLSEIQSAIGRVALRELDGWVARRRANAARLAGALTDVPGIRIPLPSGGVQHAYYRLMGRVDTDALAPGWTRDRMIAAIAAEGVPCFFGTCAEIYRERAFADAGFAPAERLPGARTADAESIAFLVHSTLEAADIDDTAAAVAKVMAVAHRSG
jgi:hypothetical protein